MGEQQQPVPWGSSSSFLEIMAHGWVTRDSQWLQAQVGKSSVWLLLWWSGVGRSPMAASWGAASGNGDGNNIILVPARLVAPARKAGGFVLSWLFILLEAGSCCS